MEITKNYLLKGSQRRSGLLMPRVSFIVAHDVGNDKSSTALQNVQYYQNPLWDTTASAHLFIDDVNVIECIPTGIDTNIPPEKAWHVRYLVGIDKQLFGASANNEALSVELCYFPSDRARSILAYKNYVALIAKICQRYNLDPKTKIVAHSRLDPGRKIDPGNAFQYIGMTWDKFILDVVAAMSDPLVTIQVPQSKVERVKSYLLTI